MVAVSAPRPSVSAIVPFAGSKSGAAWTLASLAALELREGDEVIVVDNSLDGCFPSGEGVQVIPAVLEQSSYYARNAGAERACGEWLLFMDADCRPGTDLIDKMFDPAPSARCGIVAGAVAPDPGQPGLAPAYARARGHLDGEWHAMVRPGWPHPAGITGNLMVRTATWSELGGFAEAIKSGGDVEFCWRAQDAGWQLERRPDAIVVHAHVTSLAAMSRQARRHAAGRRWVNERYSGAFPRPRLIRPFARSSGAALIRAVTGHPHEALFKLIDARWALADFFGYAFGDNRAPRRQRG